MTRLKRISMAGSDVAVTAAPLADLVLEYAVHLGRTGTTDALTVPVARDGRARRVSLLLGPASRVALLDEDDPALQSVELPRLEVSMRDLRARIDFLAGHPAARSDEPG